MPEKNAIIQIQNAVFSYPEATQNAVDDVSLDIGAGAFVAILGHNGSGKSTLAKLMNALFTPSAGTVTVGGLTTSDEGNIWDVRSVCGMVFQNPDNQLVATVVEEDVAFGLENMGVESALIRTRVDEALRMVGMSEHAKSAPHLLSGGQKQRIAIAGVLAMRPKVIVFDEATAMLDPAGRRDVLAIVRKLNKDEHITIVWITHFMEEAAYADRVVLMDNGKIKLEGAPREVFRHTDVVREIGLDVPDMTALCERLRADGLDLPEGILTVDEMVVELCRLKFGN